MTARPEGEPTRHTRRCNLPLLVASSLIAFSCQASRADTDPLSSWNDGPSKKAIVDFVRATTDKGRSKFVAPEERIVTLDNDGTLWVEQPMYTQGMFALDRVAALAPKHPEWKTEQPFQAILTHDREAME